jgi:hypothetical protein
MTKPVACVGFTSASHHNASPIRFSKLCQIKPRLIEHSRGCRPSGTAFPREEGSVRLALTATCPHGDVAVGLVVSGQLLGRNGRRRVEDVTGVRRCLCHRHSHSRGRLLFVRVAAGDAQQGGNASDLTLSTICRMGACKHVTGAVEPDSSCASSGSGRSTASSRRSGPRRRQR